LLAVDSHPSGGRSSGEGSDIERARRFLAAVLKDGPEAVKTIVRWGEAAGMSEHTLNKAKRDLQIQSEKLGLTGGWQWRLPNPDELDIPVDSVA
jgi:hypothetical protein